MNRKYFLFFLLMCLPFFSSAQEVADKIVGVVGNKIILQSDIDLQYKNDPALKNVSEDTAKCNILYTLLAQQILVEEAGRDSVIVSPDEVEKRIDRRVRQFIVQYGGREALERASGQSIYQLKAMYRVFFKDKMTADRMQQQLMKDIGVTPSEVEAFFNKIPKDSLPMLPATIEMGEIVIKPKVSKVIQNLAKQKLEGIRKEIVVGGKSFATMASIYSMDPSHTNGGLITINKKDFDPRFVAAAFRLQPGEVSPVIKSQFGYHIIKMIKKMGNEAQVRHILIIPEVTSVGIKRTLKKLDSVRADLIAGKLTFPEAVAKYSTDKMDKMTGGMILDPKTGGASIEIKNLTDAQMVRAAGELKIGEYSQPQTFRDARTRTQECRILYLKSRTEPHRLNLKQDYSLIQSKALSEKKNKFLFHWLQKKTADYYIHVAPEFRNCPELQKWHLSDDKVSQNG